MSEKDESKKSGDSGMPDGIPAPPPPKPNIHSTANADATYGTAEKGGKKIVEAILNNI